ncbi:membrane protein DedA with SNARE-associated domain [Haloactinopolyspora alba]|uniref:Membrane protein DedA with SNARE-associated domain n=1 Tax=Haloactinopolyspora alba TaxID=648780 RepID=A0A2P8E7K6_9ACTN|nr:VTT domain-containing protein [Haloactinopolyspora alba]PSL05452.1 membrane protein DedA with SNARE-associated domain [Haloactinopolyspora alba]
MSFVAVPVAAYLVMAALVALDALFPALPGEVFVVSAGALSAAGHLDLGWTVAAAAAGAVTGDLTVYAISRHRLPRVLDRSRLGRRIQASVDRAHARMGSTSAAAIIAARFVPLGRTTVSAAAGLAGIRPRRFAVLAAVGAASWASFTAGLGFVTGNVTDAPLLLQVAIGVAIGVVVGVWAGTLHTISRTRRRMSGRAARDAESSARSSREPGQRARDEDPPRESGPSRLHQLAAQRP